MRMIQTMLGSWPESMNKIESSENSEYADSGEAQYKHGVNAQWLY